MKFKKLVSIFLSCALMAGMMAGCAGDTGTSSAPATDGQVSEAATGDDTTAGGNHKIYLITMDQMASTMPLQAALRPSCWRQTDRTR